MRTQPIVRRNDLAYPELSYKINGILFDVFKELGAGYQERYYQRAIALAFKKNHVRFQEQIRVPLQYASEAIGSYVLDFFIEDCIVLEIKKGDYFKKQNLNQVIGYLKAKNLRLGLIANFTSNGVKIRRILNLA
jgi:GxxExxY protein